MRYQAVAASPSGRYPGVFALANGLAEGGELSAAERARWRVTNDWFDVAYRDPGAVDPDLFNRRVNPQTSCWFKASASHLLERVAEYLALLDRHGIAWVELRRDVLRPLLYEDEVQAVVGSILASGHDSD